MKRTNLSQKGNTLTLEKLEKFYNEMKDIPQPKYFVYEKVIMIDFKFPFIHRVRRVYPE